MVGLRTRHTDIKKPARIGQEPYSLTYQSVVFHPAVYELTLRPVPDRLVVGKVLLSDVPSVRRKLYGDPQIRN